MAKANDSANYHDAEDRKVAKKHPDYKLITECVEYTFAMGAANLAYRTDPTDGKVAGPIDKDNLDRSRDLLLKAAKRKAETFDGLFAKSQVGIQICRKGDVVHMDCEERDFLKSLGRRCLPLPRDCRRQISHIDNPCEVRERSAMSEQTKKSKTKSADHTLIGHCVAFVSNRAGYKAGFNADWTDDWHFAACGRGKLGGPMHDVWTASLAAATKIKAKTRAGVQAKAAVVPFLLDTDETELSEAETAFVLSFAADAAEYLRDESIAESERERAAKGFQG